MDIEICSQARALKMAEAASRKTSVISITSKEENEVDFAGNPHIASVLHLKCNDLTAEYDEEGIPYGRPLPVREDFAGLKEFVDGLSCDCLIIHCWEGTSRSAAVGKAVYEYRGSRDTVRAGNRVSPNPLVYELACRELEIVPDFIKCFLDKPAVSCYNETDEATPDVPF